MRHTIAFLLAFSIQSQVHAQVASQAAPGSTPPDRALRTNVPQKGEFTNLGYSSAVWRVYSEVKRYEGRRYLLFRDGSKKEIGPGSMIASDKVFIYSLSNVQNSAESRVCQTTLDAPPSVVTVLKDGTLVLGVQRDEYYIRFIGRDPKVVDVIAKADGVSYEPVYAADDLLLMRSRDQTGVKQVFVVPLSAKALAFTRRVLLTDEAGRPAALPNSVRFEREGSLIRWHDTDKVHSFTIPESVSGKP